MSIFGWDLPPGCSVRDIEDAMGAMADLPENCLGCRAELTEVNDPELLGVCGPDCVWPAIGYLARQDQECQEDADRLSADWAATQANETDQAE